MVSGWKKVDLAQINENDETGDNEVETGLADEGRFTPTIDSNNVIPTQH